MTTYPNATHVSEHFTWEEVRCHCGCPLMVDVKKKAAKQAAALEKFRRAIGNLPVSVHCWHRCAGQNAKVGGAKASKHMEGSATDLHVAGIPHAKLREVARAIPEFIIGGIGIYDWGVHLDTAVDRVNRPAQWDERT